MIVGISGLSGSGKDEVGKVLVEQHHFVRVAFADVMKRICMEVFDFTEEQVWGDGKNVPDKRYPTLHQWEDGDAVCRSCGEALCATEQVGDVKRLSPCHLTPRRALQRLGSWGRECYPMVWAEHTLRVANKLLKKDGNVRLYNKTKGLWVHEIIRDLPEEHIQRVKEQVPKGVVITDVRFKNEMKAVKDAGGKLIRVVRPGHEKPKWNHPSETEQLEVPDSEFDFILWNDEDLNTLKEKTRRMLLGLSYDGCGSI